MSAPRAGVTGDLVGRLRGAGLAPRVLGGGEAGAAQAGDLEIAVDPGAAAAACASIEALGFKRPESSRVAGEAGVVEYLGLDEATGRLIALTVRENAGVSPGSRGPRAGRERGKGGLMIALVGTRGSGKTTLCDVLLQWLSPRVAVRGVYFGSGDGPVSILRWPLRTLHRVFARRRPAPRGPAAEVPDSAAIPEGRGARALPGFGLVEPIWALLVAREKGRALSEAWRARDDGLVVICDRYPQNEVPGVNDGPLLARWLARRGGLLRRLAAWEGRPYAWAHGHPPDLIIRLRVSEAVARARRPRADAASLRTRRAAVERLTFGAERRIVDVDADAPLDRVVLDVKRCVWGAL